MSSQQNPTQKSTQKSAAGGTQSPPLEATGAHVPMGASSVDAVAANPDNVKEADVVPDTDQRSQYMSDSGREAASRTTDGAAKSRS
ncbi:hypothetical protein BD779DRAFT_1672728 [Infundibulicybe gibba]|nr:hypothetical protein BD779DRAFT_1672728 [Infundibulicybe gibba]